MRVDVHAHYMPSELAEVFEQLGGAPIRMRHDTDMTARLADMKDGGIDRQILSLGGVHPYWKDRTAAVEGARAANDVYHRALAEHPGRFGAFGAVPLPHAQEAACEAVRCLDELGFQGIGLGCSAAGRPLDDPEFEPMWAELDRREAVVHLHPGVANRLAVGISDYPMLLGPTFGSPTETAVAAVRLVLSGLTTRHPGIRFLVAAMGGALPHHWHKLLRNASFISQGAASLQPIRLVEHLRRFSYDTSHLDAAYVVAAREAGLIDRLVLGSDAPWGKSAESVAAVNDCDQLSAGEKKHILDHGAEALLAPSRVT
ncbi:amidohydrolase family protein [Streptomyces sp. NPDC006285]|uniref:amidohydrolase family protein n=1 Tax=Streptomyces sp. NPDC006285 TaxID=3364742 RepID=UPI0036CDAC25